MLVFEYLEKWAKERPEREAIVYADRRVTYADYDREVNRVARGLLKLGVRRGDKVGLYIPNHPEFVFGYLACAKLGAAAVPVTWRFAASEVKYILGHSDSSVVIMETSFMDSDFIEKINAVRDDLPELRDIVIIGSPEDVARVPGAMSYDDFLSRRPRAGPRSWKQGSERWRRKTSCSCSSPPGPPGSQRPPCSPSATWYRTWRGR